MKIPSNKFIEKMLSNSYENKKKKTFAPLNGSLNKFFMPSLLKIKIISTIFKSRNIGIVTLNIIILALTLTKEKLLKQRYTFFSILS